MTTYQIIGVTAFVIIAVALFIGAMGRQFQEKEDQMMRQEEDELFV